MDLNNITEGEIVFNQGTPTYIKNVNKFQDFWKVFAKAVQNYKSFSFLQLLIPFADADEVNSAEVSTKEKDKRKIVVTGGLFSWDFLEEFHPCSAVPKARAGWGDWWKEHCDHIDDEIPVKEWVEEKIDKVKKAFKPQKAQ